jgi:hypothetical protein
MPYPTDEVLRALPPSVIRFDSMGDGEQLWPVGVLLEQRATSSLCHLRLRASELSADQASQLVQLTATDPHKLWTLHLQSFEDSLEEFANDWLKVLRVNGGRSSLTSLSITAHDIAVRFPWPNIISLDRSLVSLTLDCNVSLSCIVACQFLRCVLSRASIRSDLREGGGTRPRFA